MSAILNPAIVYNYASEVDASPELAGRFVRSYIANPPGIDHQTIIICNQNKPCGRNCDPCRVRALFSPLPNCHFFEHDDSGWEIGGYQAVAKAFPDPDFAVFFGGSAYLLRPDWLARMAGAWLEHGDTLYGATGNTGDYGVKVWPHIRTTAFWLSPALLNRYPIKVKTKEGRYPFEHGPGCLTSWIKGIGLQPWVVTWSGDWPEKHWAQIPDGYPLSLSGVLAGDRITNAPFWPIRR